MCLAFDFDFWCYIPNVVLTMNMFDMGEFLYIRNSQFEAFFFSVTALHSHFKYAPVHAAVLLRKATAQSSLTYCHLVAVKLEKKCRLGIAGEEPELAQ